MADPPSNGPPLTGTPAAIVRASCFALRLMVAGCFRQIEVFIHEFVDARFASREEHHILQSGDSLISVDDFVIVSENIAGGNRVTTGRQVPFCMFTDPELARVGLNETEAKACGIPYRLTRLPMAAVFRAMTISETRGFIKALIDTKSDRILGFTMFGAGAGDVMAAVQMTMLAGLPYTTLRDAIIAHPTMPEGLITLLSAVPAKGS